MTPSQPSSEAPPARPQPPRELPPLPAVLHRLSLPPEVAADVEAAAKRRRKHRGPERQWLEEEIKLQYFFGGLGVALIREPSGLVVVAAYDVWKTKEADLSAALAHLSAEQRRRVVFAFPDRWDEQDSAITSVFPNAD
jgi:hypothetical protein